MSAAQFSSKMLKTFFKKVFVGRYDLLKDRFLQRLPTKLLHLNVSLMMSAAQFSMFPAQNVENRFCSILVVKKFWK